MSDDNDPCRPPFKTESTGVTQAQAQPAQSDIQLSSNPDAFLHQNDSSNLATKRTGRPKGRRTTSHSHLIRPKRPRSAYNFFVRDERNKIINEAGLGDSTEPSASGQRCDPDQDHFQILVTNELQENGKRKRGRPRGRHYRPRKKAKHHGLVDFHHLAKSTGAKWRSLSAEERKPYDEQARADLEKYRQAMKRYEVEVEVFEHLQAAESGTSSTARLNRGDEAKEDPGSTLSYGLSSIKQLRSKTSDESAPFLFNSSEASQNPATSNLTAGSAKMSETQGMYRNSQDLQSNEDSKPAAKQKPENILPPAYRGVLECYQELKESGSNRLTDYSLELLGSVNAVDDASKLALKGLSTAALLNQVLESHKTDQNTAARPPQGHAESSSSRHDSTSSIKNLMKLFPKVENVLSAQPDHHFKSDSERGAGTATNPSATPASGLSTNSARRDEEDSGNLSLITHDNNHYYSLGSKQIVPRSVGKTESRNTEKQEQRNSSNAWVDTTSSSSGKQTLPDASFLVEFAEKDFDL